MNRVFQVVCAVFSGILTALAIPNEIFYLGSPFLGMIALVPLYLAAKSAKTYRQTALLFAIDALTTHLLSSFWLANFKDFAVFTLGASAAGTACIEAMAACVYHAPFASENSKPKSLAKNPPLIHSTIWFASVRVIYEWAKSTGFLAYPWGTLSMSAFRSKMLIQSADIFGAYGITFLMAFTAAALGEGVLHCPYPTRRNPDYSKSSLRNIAAATAMLAIFFAYGAIQFNRYKNLAPHKTLNAVLVQQNQDPWASQDDTPSIQISATLSQRGIDDFAARGIKADLVVWSEAVLRYPFPANYARYTLVPEKQPLVQYIRSTGIPFVIGGAYEISREKRQYANAALFFDGDGIFKGYYGKRHLVPFAEVIPGVEYEFVRNFMQRLVGFSNGWTPGEEFRTFEVPLNSAAPVNTTPTAASDATPPLRTERFSVQERTASPSPTARISIPICFEDAFPDVCGPLHQLGTEVFVNITDDSWSLTKSAEYQHFVVAAFRAIEYRTTLVRATNAGYTTVIDPAGRITQSLPLFEKGYLCAEIPIYPHHITPHSAHTNFFAHAILLLAGFVLAQTLARNFRREP